MVLDWHFQPPLDWTIKPIIQDILHFSLNFDSAVFNLVLRDFNGNVHLLVKLVLNTTMTLDGLIVFRFGYRVSPSFVIFSFLFCYLFLSTIKKRKTGLLKRQLEFELGHTHLSNGAQLDPTRPPTMPPLLGSQSFYICYPQKHVSCSHTFMHM